MSLDEIIKPEITVGSELGLLLEQLAARPDVKTILEIGSSSGDGSTACFVKGMDANPEKPTLHGIEMSHARFGALRTRWGLRPDIYLWHGCSVDLGDFMLATDVSNFYRFIPTNLNKYPLEQVLGWLEQDVRYVAVTQTQHSIIKKIKTHPRAKASFLNWMVLIDGSAFTAQAELNAVYGAKIIVLDDTNDIKNYANYHRLKSDPTYRLLAENPNERNGYAAFERIP